jgi:hypothetical protein
VPDSLKLLDKMEELQIDKSSSADSNEEVKFPDSKTVEVVDNKQVKYETAK